MGIQYTQGKLTLAVDSLATGIGGIKERLEVAFINLHSLTPSDFPDRLKSDWKFITDTLLSEEPTYNEKNEVVINKVQNSLKKLDLDDCVEVAQAICNLYFRLNSEE